MGSYGLMNECAVPSKKKWKSSVGKGISITVQNLQIGINPQTCLHFKKRTNTALKR